MRHLVTPAVLIAALVAPTLARADAVTTRIETRPYYGAIVTIEQGVRVWRALPPHDRIIIVPENAKNVKVHVNVGDNRPQLPPVTMNSNVNISQSSSSAVSGGGGFAVPYGHGRQHASPYHPSRHGSFGPGRRH